MTNKINEKKAYLPPVDVRWFVQTLLLPDVKGNKDEAQRRTGVDKGKFYYHFKKNAEFRAWYSTQCDLALDIAEPEALSGLLRKVRQGNLGAINTYFEMRKKLKRQLDKDSPLVGAVVYTQIWVNAVKKAESIDDSTGRLVEDTAESRI